MSFFTTSTIIGTKIWIQYKFSIHGEGAYGNEHINMDICSRAGDKPIYVFIKKKDVFVVVIVIQA